MPTNTEICVRVCSHNMAQVHYASCKLHMYTLGFVTWVQLPVGAGRIVGSDKYQDREELEALSQDGENDTSALHACDVSSPTFDRYMYMFT